MARWTKSQLDREALAGKLRESLIW